MQILKVYILLELCGFLHYNHLITKKNNCEQYIILIILFNVLYLSVCYSVSNLILCKLSYFKLFLKTVLILHISATTQFGSK